MDSKNYASKIGIFIQETRQARGMTQADLAKALNTSQSAINRIEKGGQNISLDMLGRISEVLSSQIVSLNQPGTVNLRIEGGTPLSGSITAFPFSCINFLFSSWASRSWKGFSLSLIRLSL
jgi:UDP-N-acetylglucosamine 1-carboxyvinyltransferase